MNMINFSGGFRVITNEYELVETKSIMNSLVEIFHDVIIALIKSNPLLNKMYQIHCLNKMTFLPKKYTSCLYIY
jgi:hypothetical protein